ncbi:hypothetical protein D3C72_1324460 [compost metagenome]
MFSALANLISIVLDTCRSNAIVLGRYPIRDKVRLPFGTFVLISNLPLLSVDAFIDDPSTSVTVTPSIGVFVEESRTIPANRPRLF